MGIEFDARNTTTKRLIELLEEAQDVANILHKTVTVTTDTGIVEVPPDEKEYKGKPPTS